MVNGMHIYGWPISAKLADSDWNNRRNPPVGGIETGWPNRKYRTEKLVRRDRYEVQHRFVNQQDNRSFVEVVKEDRSGEKGRKDGQIRHTQSLYWKGDKETEVEDWLSCIAIGKLKVFDCIDHVNRNLEVRGIDFSSSYMGGNYIAWTFGSNYDRDGFIDNGFLWRNCFSSMMEWKENWANDSKLIWVDIYGVPLSCWYKVVPSEILVKSGKRDFRVRLEEPLIPVLSEWLSRRLGLKSELKNKINQEDDGGECCGASGEGEWGLVERCQGKSNRAGGMNAGLRKSNEKEENIGV
ncbi:hypothetical protein Q3G72_035284 [Acer saccharum]|nr:hypothetical protein Q3G72_035284 [Acer saccharum]